MSTPGRVPWTRAKVLRLAAVALTVDLGLVAVFLLPSVSDWFWSTVNQALPLRAIWFLRTGALFLIVPVVSLVVARKPRRIGLVPVPRVFWERLEGAAGWVIGGRLSVALAVAAGLMMATWVPHYLTWPWWADTDYFAISAQSWDAGILPYRDLYDFNFPGPTYVHWLLGKAFGWGRTVPFNALDVALIVALGSGLTLWSRERFGGAAPGLIGFLAALGYYLGLDYTLVAQRDWHATLLTVLGLLALEARRDRIGLVGSALLFAGALTIRPHALVFLPALLSAIDENARAAGEPPSRTLKAVASWSGVVALGLLAGAAPVVLAGVADDFLYWFRFAWFGGSYHRAASRSITGEILDQLGRPETVIVLAVAALLSLAGPLPRRTARTWSLALLFVLLYLPLSPVPHGYLIQPSMLVWSVALAVVSAWPMALPRLSGVARLLAVGLVLSYTVPLRPPYCRPLASLRAAADLARGRAPDGPPPGCEWWLKPRRIGEGYCWGDYQGVLEHLRTKTGPETFVANFFRRHPYPTVNGPVGRLSAFPSPGGILWLKGVDPGLEEKYVEALSRPRRTVVVWVPGLKPYELPIRLERLERVIRRDFRPEARFGPIEVWRRRADDTATGLADRGGDPGRDRGAASGRDVARQPTRD